MLAGDRPARGRSMLAGDRPHETMALKYARPRCAGSNFSAKCPPGER
jgi:hypothetical protein